MAVDIPLVCEIRFKGVICMPPILFVLFAAVLLIILSGGYVFFFACMRRKERPWLDEQKINKTSYAKYYKYICRADRWLKDHHAKDIFINTTDGLKLHGLWIPTENPKGTMVLAHGYRSTILLDFYLAYEFFHDLGYNLLVPNQRAHGKSEGRFITFGVKESGDMRQWIEYHNREFGYRPVVLFGISMGASTMLYLADEKLPDNVRGIIADCGYTSPRDILASVYKRITHLPAGLSLWSAEWFARIFAGFSLTQKSTERSLAHSRLPVLLIHGKGDGFVPCEMTQRAFDSCIGEKTVLLVDNADHGHSFWRDPEQYGSLVKTFLKKHVEEFS